MAAEATGAVDATGVTGAGVDPFTYPGPNGERLEDETRVFANANGVEWGYLDACREISDALIAAGAPDHLVRLALAKRVPDGWAHAYLEYRRREGSDAIREAFRTWRDHGTLPGLD